MQLNLRLAPERKGGRRGRPRGRGRGGRGRGIGRVSRVRGRSRGRGRGRGIGSERGRATILDPADLEKGMSSLQYPYRSVLSQ